MSSSPSFPEAHASWLEREAVLDRFETAWQKAGDARIEEFLPPPGSPRTELLHELIKIDLEYRWKHGQRPRIDDYTCRFPELGGAGSMPLGLIREEIRNRRRCGCAPSEAELRERFADRAAELVDDRAVPAALPPIEARSRLGRYELREQIGRGGCATVYRAWDPELQREVAIKVPHAAYLEDTSSDRRLLREASSAARLRHPGIVTTHEVGQDGRTPFIVCEFISGPTLAEVLRQSRPSPQEAAQWARRIALALDYAHQCGIVHRDVKPANIMMDGDGQPLLADFGLALQTDGRTLTQEGDVLGTPAYMSPEQAAGRGHNVDARTDVYSLGVVLYEMLCGRPPFLGSGASVLHRIIHEEPSFPRHHCPTVPVDLETICLKAMSKEPRRRYASAGALADDLGRYLEHRPIQARRIGPIGRLARWCRRQPALASSIAIGIVTSLTIGALSFQRVVHERDRYQAERDHAQLLLADMALDKGIGLCEQGEVGYGMLWLVRSLELAPADAQELRWTIRANLAAWQHQLSRPKLVLQHAGDVRAVAFHPNGKVIASASRHGGVRLWDIVSWRSVDMSSSVNASANKEEYIGNVAFSPDGQIVVANALSAATRLWEAETGQSLGLALPLGQNVLCSQDGAYLLSVSGLGDAELWETWTRRSLGAVRDGRHCVNARDFDAKNGRLAVFSEHEQIWLWPNLRSEPRLLPEAQSLAIFSPDAQTLWTASADKSARAWNAETGQPLGIALPHQESVNSLASSPDGNTILTGSNDRTARLWDARSGRPIGAPLRHPDRVRAVAFAPDGRNVVTGSSDHGVRMWELPALPSSSPVLTHEHPVWSLALSADGGTLLTGCGIAGPGNSGSAQLWDARNGAHLGPAMPHHHMVKAVTISRDGETLLTGDWNGTVRSWRAGSESDRSNRPLAPPLLEPHGHGAVLLVALSPDERALLTCRLGDADTQVWDLESRKQRGSLPGHSKPVRDAVFSSDGRWILTGSYDGTARLWDASSLQPIGVPFFHEGEVGTVAFSPNSRYIIAGSDAGSAKVWEVTTGELVGSPLVHRQTIRKVAFSLDGRLILTCSTDGTARLWEATTHKPVGPPMRHEGAVETGAFTPDGLQVVTGSVDKTVRFWPVPAAIEDDPGRLALWVEAITGLELDATGISRPLSAKSWQERKLRLGSFEP